MMILNNRIKAISLFLGYLASLCAFAVCREQIFKSNYGNEKFVYPITLTALQFFMNAISAKGMMLTQNQTENETPQKYYIIIAIFNVLTMVASNMALQFIPYVVLVVGKACKPIPVIIFTAIMANKYYTIQRYIFMLMIAFGVGLFIYKEEIVTSNKMLLGSILIMISLLLEGFLAGTQAKMRTLSKPTSVNYMFYVNVWCTLLTIPLLSINFEVVQFIKFCTKHNDAILFVLVASITGSIGNYFSSAIVANLGPLPLALAATTRKFFTIFLSSLLFGNVLSWRQWIATVIIFEALILDVFFGKKNFLKSKEENSNETIKSVGVKSENHTLDNISIEIPAVA